MLADVQIRQSRIAVVYLVALGKDTPFISEHTGFSSRKINKLRKDEDFLAEVALVKEDLYSAISYQLAEEADRFATMINEATEGAIKTLISLSRGAENENVQRQAALDIINLSDIAPIPKKLRQSGSAGNNYNFFQMTQKEDRNVRAALKDIGREDVISLIPGDNGTHTTKEDLS
jgi:hypothetical protein